MTIPHGPLQPLPAAGEADGAWEELPQTGSAGGIGDIVGDVRTAVQNADAPVHTGDGSQVNVTGSDYTVYVDNSGTKRRLQHWGITEQRIRWLRPRFVEPRNYADARARLADLAGAVLLAGPAGAGKRTAAQMLLCPDDGVACSITLVPGDLDQSAVGDEYRAFDGEDVSAGERLLFDLSETDEVSFKRHQVRLDALLPAVARKAALLVVILPPDHDGLRDDFGSLRVSIAAPDRVEVLAAHLRAADRLLDPYDLSIHRSQLLPLSMAAIGYLVERVDAAHRQTPGSGLGRWLSEALNSEAPRDALAARLLSDHPQAEPRVLLLSAAMLEHAPVDAVFDVQRGLLRILEFHPSEDLTGIEFATVTQSLAGTQAGCVLSQTRRLSFADPELGPTLLRYYWDQFPWLRAEWAVWVRDLVAGGSLDPGDQKKLALRFAEQCIRSRQADLVLDVAQTWSGRGN